MTHKTAAMCLCAVLLGGCSSVNVVKSPSPDDNGIRYYRPKPYLMVTPADATGRMVKLEVLYLPDYCEEYSIHPRGKKPPAVQLQDGWNLVGVGGGPAPAEKGGGGAPTPPPTDPIKLPENVLVAGNVPIGLYESVFDYAGPAKYLKGWRYVGFSPLGGGGLPNGTDAAGTAHAQQGCPNCTGSGSVIQGPLFGLVFFNGAMTFRPLDEIANNMTCPQYAKTTVEPTPPPPVNDGGAEIKTVPERPKTGGAQVIPSTPNPAASPPMPNPATPGPSSSVAPKPSAMRAHAGLTPAAGQGPTAAVKVDGPVDTLFLAPQPAEFQVDATVTQTSSQPQAPAAKVVTPAARKTRPVAVKRVSPTATRSSSASKANPNSLEALEAEVFKSLNYTPPAAKGSTTSSKGSAKAPATARAMDDPSIPELSPAMPIR